MMVKLNGGSWLRGTCLGRGANGTVNLALNVSIGRVFAVKSVELGSSSATASQLQALENEIQILKSLSCPHVVSYLGDDETGSFRNLHMEYMPGGTAADLRSCDERVVRSYTRCLVSALSYLHSRGIVHCDVKGRNVLLGPSPGSAKLADFGSAAMISEGRISPRGSPLWMAPEVVRGEYQGPESDVWSLGCTVIEMVTGKPAWDSVSRIIRSAELPEFPAKLSKLGCDFVRKCLQRDAKNRWSCDQLLQHPFLSRCSLPYDPTAGSSPRCVLDLSDLDFSDDEETDRSDDEHLNLKAMGRMRGLITGTTRANWESDGWVNVRGTASQYFHSGAGPEIPNLPNPSKIANSGLPMDHSIFIGSLSVRKKNVDKYCSFPAFAALLHPCFYVMCLDNWFIILFTNYNKHIKECSTRNSTKSRKIQEMAREFERIQ